MQAKFIGPYKVLQAFQNHTYRITRQEQESIQSEQRLKKYHEADRPAGRAPVELEPRRRPNMKEAIGRTRKKEESEEEPEWPVDPVPRTQRGPQSGLGQTRPDPVLEPEQPRLRLEGEVPTEQSRGEREAATSEESHSRVEVHPKVNTPGPMRGMTTPRRPTPAIGRAQPSQGRLETDLTSSKSTLDREGVKAKKRGPAETPQTPITPATPVTTRRAEEDRVGRPRRVLKLPTRLQDYELYSLDLPNPEGQDNQTDETPRARSTEVPAPDGGKRERSYRDVLLHNLPEPGPCRMRMLKVTCCGSNHGPSRERNRRMEEMSDDWRGMCEGLE